jgi:hypothetical protein
VLTKKAIACYTLGRSKALARQLANEEGTAISPSTCFASGPAVAAKGQSGFPKHNLTSGHSDAEREPPEAPAAPLAREQFGSAAEFEDPKVASCSR